MVRNLAARPGQRIEVFALVEDPIDHSLLRGFPHLEDVRQNLKSLRRDADLLGLAPRSCMVCGPNRGRHRRRVKQKKYLITHNTPLGLSR